MRASKLTLSLVVLLLVLATAAQAFPVSAHTGCVRTPGYWKNHLGDWGWIDPYSSFFNSGQTYIQVLNTPPRGGNAYYILAHAWIAAQINFQYATAPQFVVDAFWAAAAYFAGATADRATLLYWATILDNYNNGIGDDVPPHCD